MTGIEFIAVGDVGAERDHPAELFESVHPVLRAADIAFCQLEIALTDRGTRVPHVRHTARSSPATAEVLRDAGFGVVSWASNHCMDWGPDGFYDTIDALEASGATVVGVGPDLASARRVRTVEVDGVRTAFLAYCSILPEGYWATDRRPGCAPLRAHTVYEQIERDQPGTGCTIHTFPFPEDLEQMSADIAAARADADAVVVSMHWGLHFVPATLARYQRTAAHHAIDAGADLILGHHAHILKPIEIYRGKAIFYSIGNFAMDLPMTEEHATRPSFLELKALHPGWEVDLDSTYNFPFDSRKTVAVTARISEKGVLRCGFRPAYIGTNSVPEFLEPEDPRFGEVIGYLAEICESQGIGFDYSIQGNEVVLVEIQQG
ncbi:CapA family protein [Nocardia sp. NBC_00416]|uniref:CapA family protein n=1 Tax=Nocardia sp. NBC_00416 TaxID=2975991 RepID=UPI002E1ADAD4